MKHFKSKLISCALAAVTAFSVSTSFKKFAAISASAATNEQFLSEVGLVYEDTYEDAKEAVKGTDWKVFNRDLNPDADYMFDNGVYLIYKTSTNVEDAITDLRVMDMYGGYSSTNYKAQIEQSRDSYEANIDDLRVAVDEFKKLYNAGDAMAQLAYRQMNYYKDVKTANGTETDMLMGDFFLNMPADDEAGNNQIIQVMMEGNTLIVSNLVSLLAVVISGGSEESLATKIAEAYANKDNLSHIDYHDAATAIAKSLNVIKAKVIRYDALKEEYDLEDEEITDEEYTFLTQYATIAELLTEIEYGNQTLAEFIKGSWMTQDLYPIVAAFTPGQKALVGMGQLETVLKYNCPSKPIDELTQALEEMEEMIKDENGGVLPTYDVYTGVDREIFKGDLAMTTEAERQQALTGETWTWSDAASRGLGVKIGYIVASAVDAALFGVFAGLAIKTSILKAGIYDIIPDAVLGLIDGQDRLLAFTAKWGGLKTACMWASIALTLIILGSYGITTWYNYYNPDYLEIPNTLIDVRETDLGDKYVKYTAAKVHNGEEGQEVADFNAYEGKEWIALYYTKDANAGNCLTPNFVPRDNTNAVAKRHQGISMFGENVAFNLNSHTYDKDAPGVYLTVRYSTTKKAAADMPTVVGSMLTGAYYVLTAIGGVGVGAGGMALFQHLKNKKKDEEIVPEEETTTGE